MTKKNWQEEIRESAHKIWLAGLGALAVAEEEGSKLFSTLVQEGEKFESAGKDRWQGLRKEVDEATERARRSAGETWSRVEGTVDDAVARALRRVGVPTRDEITALSRRVAELTAAVERLRARPEAGGATAPTGPPAVPEIKTPEDVTTTPSDVKVIPD